MALTDAQKADLKKSRPAGDITNAEGIILTLLKTNGGSMSRDAIIGVANTRFAKSDGYPWAIDALESFGLVTSSTNSIEGGILLTRFYRLSSTGSALINSLLA